MGDAAKILSGRRDSPPAQTGMGARYSIKARNLESVKASKTRRPE